MNVRVRDYSEIRKAGIESLSRDLGPVGMVYFLRQFEHGEGDYTKERKMWIDDIDIEDILSEVEKIKNKKVK